MGTGALGSTLLERLSADRYPFVLLVDPDAVEPRNLKLSPWLRRAASLQSLRSEAFPSQNKAELLAAAAQSCDGLAWRAMACQIADVGWMDLQNVDLFCCCTDSVLSRVETAWIARALGRPVLDGAVFGQEIEEGRVSWFPGTPKSACYLCGLTEERRAAVLGEAGSTSMGCQAPESAPAMTGTLATLGAVADGMLAQLRRWPEFAAGAAWAMRLARTASGPWNALPVQLARSATCPWHEGSLRTLEPLPWEEPVSHALVGGRRELILDWPVCTEARCLGCGTRSQPMQRVARARQAACTVCEARQLHPLRVIHRIRHGDPFSVLSPRQLGAPERHLYLLHEIPLAGEG